MKKLTLLAAVLTVGMISTANADDYLNFQFGLLSQDATNKVNANHVDDVTQDATNIVNSASYDDNDMFNDDYRSYQRAIVDQLARNKVDVNDADDIVQTAVNAGNLYSIEDKDGLFFMGDQDVRIRQRVTARQEALNVADVNHSDDIDQEALNIGNQASIEFKNPDFNVLDVRNRQTALLSQTATNKVNGGSIDHITQAATNVGNLFSSTH